MNQSFNFLTKKSIFFIIAIFYSSLMAVSIKPIVDASNHFGQNSNEEQIKEAELELIWFENRLNETVKREVPIFDSTLSVIKKGCCYRIYQFAGRKFCFSIHPNFYFILLLETQPESWEKTTIPILSTLICKDILALNAELINTRKNFIDLVNKKLAKNLRKYNLRYELRKNIPTFFFSQWLWGNTVINLSQDFLKITTHLLEAIPSLLNSEYLIKKYCDKINQLRQKALNVEKDGLEFISICFETYDLFNDVIFSEFIPLLQEASSLDDLNYKFSKMKNLSIELTMPNEVFLQKTFVKIKNKFNDSHRNIQKPFNVKKSILNQREFKNKPSSLYLVS